MTRTAPAIAALAVLWIAAGVSAADSPDAEGSGIAALIAQIFNAALLLGILIYFARKPLQNFFKGRSEQLAAEIERAEASVREARGELESWQQRIEDFEAESQRILETTSDLARTERDQLVERAQAAAARIRDEAGAAADRELERARNELRAEAADLATELAADLIRGALTPEDDRRLLAEFSGRVRTNGELDQ